MAEDYYKTLGIDRSSSADEIKKAYRKLALKFHPDRNPGNKEAEEQFKKISEAYAVLSDQEKKKQYDTFGSQAFSQKFSQEDIFRNFDFSSIFRDLGFGGGGGTGEDFTRVFMGGRQQAGRDSFSDFLGGQRYSQQPRPHKGGDLEYNLSITLEEAYTGSEKRVSLRKGNETEEIQFKIPKGISSGQKLRLSGKGNPGAYGGPNGDLYINVKVIPHKVFERDGNDIFVDKNIKFTEAILGTSVEVPTLDGTKKRLRVPPNTQNNTKVRMKGYGLPFFKKSGRGDQYVRIRIKIPKKQLSEKQLALVKKLADEGL